MAQTRKLEPSCGTADHPKGNHPRLAWVDPESCERAAAIFRALGDTQRLRMLTLLASGERCVTELALQSSEGLSTVSQRLRLLRAERLVKARREGKHIHYSLADQHIVDLIANALAHASEEKRD